jgi:hypothetical protein
MSTLTDHTTHNQKDQPLTTTTTDVVSRNATRAAPVELPTTSQHHHATHTALGHMRHALPDQHGPPTPIPHQPATSSTPTNQKGDTH